MTRCKRKVCSCAGGREDKHAARGAGLLGVDLLCVGYAAPACIATAAVDMFLEVRCGLLPLVVLLLVAVIVLFPLDGSDAAVPAAFLLLPWLLLLC